MRVCKYTVVVCGVCVCVCNNEAIPILLYVCIFNPLVRKNGLGRSPEVNNQTINHVNGYKPLVSEDFTELEIL